jgi:hypothetical protein
MTQRLADRIEKYILDETFHPYLGEKFAAASMA